MHVKVKKMTDVVRSEFAKVGFIPHHMIICTNAIQSRNDGENGVEHNHVSVILKSQLNLLK